MPFTTQTSEFYGWWLRHNNRVVWKHLFDAGIDTFTSGPSNNTQAFLDLMNVVPAMNGGFQRRWGVTQYATIATPAVTNPVRTFLYNVPQDQSQPGNTANTNLWIVTDNQNFTSVIDTGGIFTGHGPSNFTHAGNVGAVTSREWFYYGNGVDAPRKVYPGYTVANTDSLNGIVIPSVAPGTSYQDYPNVYGFGVGTGYGYSSAPTVTVLDVTGGSGTGCTITTSLGAGGAVVGATITNAGSGYTNAYAVVGSGGTAQAYLTLYTQQNSSAPNYGKVVGYDLAGPMSFVEGRQYGVALQNSLTGHTSDVAMTSVGLDAITDLPRTPTTGSGFNGLTSVYNTPVTGGTNYPVYVTSINALGQAQTAGFTQIVSTITVPGTAYGLDPQVDTVILLATSDGGDVGTLYQVAIIPLSSFTSTTSAKFPSGCYTYTYTDTLPDSYNNSSNIYGTTNTLLASNLWAETDSAGNTYGITLNTPPTALGFLYPTLHQGRMFATDGKSVFFSKSLDEVTTSTGLVTSKWEECWPGDYVLPIALNNEVIVGIKSDGTNLHVGTDKSIFTVYGSDPSNFDVPSVAFAQTGVYSNDTWNVIYAEGQPSGFVWLTPDFKVMHSDFSTYRDIGTPIYPLLEGFFVTVPQFKLWALTQGPYNFVILQVQNAGYPAYFIWESRLQKWYRWTLPSFSAFSVNPSISFVYQAPSYTLSTFSPGTRFLMFWGVSTSPSELWIYYFNPLQLFDFSNTGISWNVQTSWQDCGDATAIKVINEIELTSDETAITVSLYGATSQSQFESGGTLLKTGTPIQGPINSLDTLKLYCAGTPTTAKYYSLQFSPQTTGTTANVLTSFSFEYFPMARI